MREQTVAPRAGRERAAGGKGRAGDIFTAQQPAPRRGAPSRGKGAAGKQSAARPKGGAWRSVRAWLPLTIKLTIAVCACLLLFRGYRAAAASEFFELKSVDVTGTARASDDMIKQIVREAAAGRGVWKVDLDAVRAEVERQPWVRAAVVSRVLPSGLRVRVTERVPRVVVRTGAGRFVWVDDDAVMVGTLAPGHQQPDFFLRGWDESGTDAARAANRVRVEKFVELSREWQAAGLAARVSEINLDDLRDVRAQLAGDDSQIEVRLGGADWTKRLIQALEALEEGRQTPRGALITYIDMTQSKRAVLGFRAGAAPPSDDAPAGRTTPASLTSDYPAAPSESNAGAKKSDAKSDATKSDAGARPSPNDAAKKSDAAKKRSDAKRGGRGEAEGRAPAREGAERPRRVGDETGRL